MHKHTSRTHGHLLPNHNNTRNNQEALILLANKFPSVPPTRKNPLKANLKAAFRIDFPSDSVVDFDFDQNLTTVNSGCLCQITTHLRLLLFPVLFYFYFIFVSQISSHPKIFFVDFLSPTHDAAADKVDSIVIIPSDVDGTLPIKIISSQIFALGTLGSLESWISKHSSRIRRRRLL